MSHWSVPPSPADVIKGVRLQHMIDFINSTVGLEIGLPALVHLDGPHSLAFFSPSLTLPDIQLALLQGVDCGNVSAAS